MDPRPTRWGTGACARAASGDDARARPRTVGTEPLGKCHVRTASTRTTPVPHGSLTPDPRAPGTQPSEARSELRTPSAGTHQPARRRSPAPLGTTSFRTLTGCSTQLPRLSVPQRHFGPLGSSVMVPSIDSGTGAPARMASKPGIVRPRHCLRSPQRTAQCRRRRSTRRPRPSPSHRCGDRRSRPGLDPEHARLRSGDGFVHRHRTKPAPVPRGGRWFLRSQWA